VKARQDDRARTKKGTEKEFHVLKHQLKDEQELHKQENELQQEQVQKGEQHA